MEEGPTDPAAAPSLPVKATVPSASLVAAYRIPSKWRSTLASHYAEIANRHRSGSRSPTRQPAEAAPPSPNSEPAVLTAHAVGTASDLRVPAGSRQLLHIIDDAAAHPTASPQHQALAVLMAMYSEAMASASVTERDPLRFSESALVISTCDSFMQSAKDFCSAIEKSIAAAIPDAVSTVAADGAAGTGGQQRPPTRGIESPSRGAQRVSGNADHDAAAIAHLGSRTSAQTASMQDSVKLMKSRFDALACSFNAVLAYVSQLETMLRSATEFRARVADVLSRCQTVSSKLQEEGLGHLVNAPLSLAATAKPRQSPPPPQQQATVSSVADQLQQAALYEAESDLEFRIVQRFAASAKREIPTRASQRGIVEGGPAVEAVDILKLLGTIVDDYFRNWRLRWDAERRDRQIRVQAMTRSAVDALREVQRLRAAALAAQQDLDAYAGDASADESFLPGFDNTPPLAILDSSSAAARVGRLQAAPLTVVLEQLRASGLRTTPLVARRTVLQQQHHQQQQHDRDGRTSPTRSLPRARTPNVGVTPLARAVAAARLDDLRATFDGSDANLASRDYAHGKNAATGLPRPSSVMNAAPMVPMVASAALPVMLGTPSPWHDNSMDPNPDEELALYRSRPSSRQQPQRRRGPPVEPRTSAVSGAHVGAAGRVGSAVLVTRASQAMVRVAAPAK